MTKLATKGRKSTDFLVWELAPEHGYSRKTATVTVETGMDIGSVLVLDTGKYVWVATADVANVANGVAILMDAVDGLAAGDHQLAVLVSDAIVAQAGLLFNGTVSAPNQTLVMAQFEAQGVKNRTQV